MHTDIAGRRDFLRGVGLVALSFTYARRAGAQQTRPMNAIEFEEALAGMRADYYRHPKVNILDPGFRPVGGKVADFAVIAHEGRYHFFYIERRLQEGTPFYPGHETYFGHASTANFFDWEVHDPVLMVRPDSWEEAHVWAPSILRRGSEYVMAYTGVNRHLSQDIGLASSRDLFTWRRWETNPISPNKGRAWSFWRADGIASCRDPYLFEFDGQIGMIYTANTREGASCIALAATRDLKSWQDHGPILIGPATGYEPHLAGGHPQGSLESACILRKRGRWYLVVKAVVRARPIRCWVFESPRHDSFDFTTGREFWPEGAGIEVVREKGGRSLLATFTNGHIRFGEVDWSVDQPTARLLTTRDELLDWHSGAEDSP